MENPPVAIKHYISERWSGGPVFHKNFPVYLSLSDLCQRWIQSTYFLNAYVSFDTAVFTLHFLDSYDPTFWLLK